MNNGNNECGDCEKEGCQICCEHDEFEDGYCLNCEAEAHNHFDCDKLMDAAKDAEYER